MEHYNHQKPGSSRDHLDSHGEEKNVKGDGGEEVFFEQEERKDENTELYNIQETECVDGVDAQMPEKAGKQKVEAQELFDVLKKVQDEVNKIGGDPTLWHLLKRNGSTWRRILEKSC